MFEGSISLRRCMFGTPISPELIAPLFQKTNACVHLVRDSARLEGGHETNVAGRYVRWEGHGVLFSASDNSEANSLSLERAGATAVVARQWRPRDKTLDDGDSLEGDIH